MVEDFRGRLLIDQRFFSLKNCTCQVLAFRKRYALHMKRFYTLIVLLALAGVMTGCDKPAADNTANSATNAAAGAASSAATAATNAPAK
jgi:hypothetical protein